MKLLALSLGVVLSISLFLPSDLAAQNSRDFRVRLRTESPLRVQRGYVHHLANDTLWVQSQFGPVSSSNTLRAYPAENLLRLRIPVGKEKKSNFGTGSVIGAFLGLTIALVTIDLDPCGRNNQFRSFCQSTNVAIILGPTIAGALGGGLIGLLVRTEKQQFQHLHINGRAERLNEQRATLERLSRWSED